MIYNDYTGKKRIFFDEWYKPVISIIVGIRIHGVTDVPSQWDNIPLYNYVGIMVKANLMQVRAVGCYCDFGPV